MADLRRTQAEWDRFIGRELIGTFLASIHELEEFEDRYTRQRTLVRVRGDAFGNAVSGGISLTGVDLGVNTAGDGSLVVRIAGAQDPRQVSLYTARGGQVAALVAQGSGDAGSVVDLAEQNRSGLSGRWELPGLVTEDLSDDLRLLPLPDWRVRLLRVWDGSVEKDVRSREVFVDALDGVAERLREARLIVIEALSEFLLPVGSRGAEFLRTSSASLVSDDPVRDRSGAVARRRTGFLPALARAMKEDSVAGEQSVAERVVKASAAMFAPANAGRGRVAVHAPREFCPAARWTFRCVRGQDSGHGGREEFEATVKVLGQDRQFQFGGVRVKQSFSGPEGIGPFVLERVFTKFGDLGDVVLSPADQATVSGEQSSNTEAGLLYWVVEETNVGFEVSFYRSSAKGSGDLVARAEGVVAGAAFVARERNVSGLTIGWRLGPQVVNASGTMNCNFFRLENAAGVPDEFVIETSVVSEGLIQRTVVEQLGGRLNSAQVGRETLSDRLLQPEP